MVKNERGLPPPSAEKATGSAGPSDAPALSAADSCYVCEQCGFTSNRRSVVTRHVKAVHEKGGLPSRQVTLPRLPELNIQDLTLISRDLPTFSNSSQG